ncbi:DUF6010 family protein [Microbulbifer yueqingensis]|uniref:Uncharacterized protein n=1 Tax=Microbulbifer yueqingensis TaxID=658219 RepID=A0A1G9CK15_9GAMM|nr:DUF6010 family protein [Microbulbifer yueqingensis]SDK51968.1 hypothetical protein SAMN05216212_2538 [Microbulbifer yueqingensis]
MEVVFWLVAGVIGSAVLVKFAHNKSPESRLNILGCALIIASFVYLGFSVLASNLIWVGIESAGVLIYGAFFVLSKSRGVNLLALGWLLHPIWDVALHLFGVGSSFAPDWYAIMCISFDITVACYIVIRARGEHFHNKIV